MSYEETFYTLCGIRSCLIRQRVYGCTKQCEKCCYHSQMGDLEQQEKALQTAIQAFYEETFER